MPSLSKVEGLWSLSPFMRSLVLFSSAAFFQDTLAPNYNKTTADDQKCAGDQSIKRCF